MKGKTLEALSERLNCFLINNVKIIPKRWKKFIAYFYTDAIVRKLYWRELNVFMGERTYANIGMIADATEEAPVIIGNNVSIAPYVSFISTSEPNNGQEIKQIAYVKNRCIKEKEIIVEDEVWLGANVTILPGVTIGKCSVIGVGALVIDNVEPYSIYAGVPARKIRDLDMGDTIDDK